jgi:hypothetical protein
MLLQNRVSGTAVTQDLLETDISVPVTYHREWQDGFGARGWKLDISIGEPSVIAATAEQGTRIPTSVLVHDILDHHLCGFAIGGHRNEAMALMQLASRTGADPRVDFRQIVDEDLMRGHCNSEPLRSFLPGEIAALVPGHIRDDKAIMDFLIREFGRDRLRDALVEHFATIGASVQNQVESHWRFLGLDYRRRSAMGMALQRVLDLVDRMARDRDWPQAHGRFLIGNRQCSVVIETPEPVRSEEPVVDAETASATESHGRPGNETSCCIGPSPGA